MNRHSLKLARFASASLARFSPELNPAARFVTEAVKRHPVSATEGQDQGHGAQANWTNFSRSLSTAAADVAGSQPTGSLPPEYVGKKVGRLMNAPKYALKHEIVRIFSWLGVADNDVSIVLDDYLRFSGWRVVFQDDTTFRKAQNFLASYRRGGPRVLRLEEAKVEDLMAESDPRHPNHIADGVRGRALVMMGLPEDVSVEDVERFFEDYDLLPQGVRLIRIFRENVKTPLRMRVSGERRLIVNIVERRALVRFRHEIDCHRALRELHKTFLQDRPIELRFVP